MARPARGRNTHHNEADPSDRPQRRRYRGPIEEQEPEGRRHRRYSEQLLRTYTRQYERRRQYQSEEEEYFERMGVPLKNRKNSMEHWHCPFFRFCWDEGMSRLPTKENCPECGQQQQQDTNRASVFRRLGSQHDESSRPATRDESDSEDDKYHRPRWCPDGLSRTQKHKVQRV